MRDFNTFQIIFTGAILGLIILALLVFAGIIPGFSSIRGFNPAKLTLWGFWPKGDFTEVVGILNEENEKIFTLDYVEKNLETYDNELLDALASGVGPDMFMLTQDMILKYRSKSFVVPFDMFSERSFRDTFIDVSDIFLWKVEGTDNGIVAVPFAIDPIVMYFNKDILNSAGIVNPPKYWDDFQTQSISLTKKDTSGNISQSGSALGEYSNINNAKDIFSMLVLQSGSKIVDPLNLDLLFGDKGSMVVEPVNSAVSFYSSFSNPSKVSYSWNKALHNSRDFFSGGKLAFYFGYASEYGSIISQNPHLNFDVTTVPQVRGSSFNATFGKTYAGAVSKSSPNIGPAISATFGFTGDEVLKQLNQRLFLPPIKRGLISEGAKDPVMSVFYKAAVQSRSWLEPSFGSVANLFQAMIEDTAYGRKNIHQAIIDTAVLLGAEMKKVRP
ncbi:MAG: extracellular solute-binding protein [Candidatus Marinimicrobia bacterium]|nr:extracellular solute-binding protein [Candidatus Neomarinimicrobiota bacterium]